VDVLYLIVLDYDFELEDSRTTKKYTPTEALPNGSPRMTDIHLLESIPATSTARVKRAPTQSGLLVPFSYTPSDDGTDENILILLHGLGTTRLFS
jgi:hypothetical protein